MPVRSSEMDGCTKSKDNEVFECHSFSNSVDVFSLHYMRKLRSALNSIGGWPHSIFGGATKTSQISTIYRCILIILCSLQIFSTIIYLKKHMDTDLGHMYVNILMVSVYLQRLFLPFQTKFCLLIKKFVFEFHLIHHKHRADYAVQVYDRVNNICTVVTAVSRVQVLLALLFYNAMPLYNSYQAGMFGKHRPQNGKFQHTVDFELPFDQYTTYHGYIIMFFYNCYVTYNVATGICIFDLLVFVIVFHIWGHLNILSYDLKYFSRSSSVGLGESSVKATEDESYMRLIDIIKHHQIIKQFMSKTSEAFSASLCVYLTFHQLCGCVLLLKSSSMDPTALGRYGIVTLIIFQELIQTSVIFELIRSKGDTLADEVYSLPWERLDTRSRRLVLIFLSNVQTSLALKAGGMVPVGVLTMSAILKTSCSYFIMLRTFTQ